MFDKQVYEAAVQSRIALALEDNDNEAFHWRARRDSWLQDAMQRRGNKQEPPPKPRPPAPMARVKAPPWNPEMTEASILTLLGPDLVDDPSCDLPPDPVPGPAGVVDVGALAWIGPPATYACGKNDTAAPGTPAEKDGRKLVKIQIGSMFGRDKFTRFYQEV